MTGDDSNTLGNGLGIVLVLSPTSTTLAPLLVTAATSDSLFKIKKIRVHID